MKFKLLAFSLQLSASLFAADSYDIQMKIYVGNKLISKPRVITVQNKMATITKESFETNEKSTIEVTPYQDPRGIYLNMKLKHFDGYEEKILARPQIITKEGQEAEFRISDNSRPYQNFKIKILANKI